MAVSITEYCDTNSVSPEECLEIIRKTIFEETKLTASAGIAPNKVSPSPSLTLHA